MRNDRERKFEREVPEYKEKLVAINRVAKVVKGGKNFRFAALVVVGDENGRVGAAIGKAKEVPEAIRKAKEAAQKNLVTVPMEGTTIPHAINGLYGTAKVVLLPAEEGAGGKVKMLANGCLKGVDAVMMSHPGKKYFTDSGSTANAGWEVTFHGKAAHAAGSPDKGINALDAVNLLFAAVGAYRQQMPGCALIHGFINNGGVAANIIPDLTKCRFYLRTSEESFMPELERRFRNMVRGAELMTDCTAEIAPFRAAYRSRRPNTPLNEEFASVIEEMGYPVVRPQFAGKGSTDFGDFSQTIPGVHTSFAIVEDGECELPGHSILFREASRSQFGFDQAMNAGAAMAKTAWRFITDEAFRAAVKEDFQKRG